MQTTSETWCVATYHDNEVMVEAHDPQPFVSLLYVGGEIKHCRRHTGWMPPHAVSGQEGIRVSITRQGYNNNHLPVARFFVRHAVPNESELQTLDSCSEKKGRTCSPTAQRYIPLHANSSPSCVTQIKNVPDVTRMRITCCPERLLHHSVRVHGGSWNC